MTTCGARREARLEGHRNPRSGATRARSRPGAGRVRAASASLRRTSRVASRRAPSSGTGKVSLGGPQPRGPATVSPRNSPGHHNHRRRRAGDRRHSGGVLRGRGILGYVVASHAANGAACQGGCRGRTSMDLSTFALSGGRGAGAQRCRQGPTRIRVHRRTLCWSFARKHWDPGPLPEAVVLHLRRA